MPGFISSISNNEEIVFANNVDFSGAQNPSNTITLDGQLLIGGTALNVGGTHINVGTLSSSNNSIGITNGQGTIDLQVNSNSFSPNSCINIFDDFLPNTEIGQLNWNFFGSVEAVDALSGNNPGLYETGDDVIAGIYLANNTQKNAFILGSGFLSCNFTFDLVTLSALGNRYVVNVGMMDTDGAIAPLLNGIYLSYSDDVNGGDWVLNCTSGGVTTSVNTAITASTGFHTCSFNVNANASNVTFYIDNAIAGSVITTNIPTTGINPAFFVSRTDGALPSFLMDLFWLSYNLTNPRLGPLGSCGCDPSIKITTYTVADSPATWTKDPAATDITVYAWGGGIGGGSGRKGTTGASGGGAAGACGSSFLISYPASFFNTTETVTVGTGGTGGASQATDDTNGPSGNAGTQSSFGNFFTTINTGPLGGRVTSSTGAGTFSYFNNSTGIVYAGGNGQVTSGGSSADSTINALCGPSGGGGAGADSVSMRTGGNSGDIVLFDGTIILAGATGGNESIGINGGNGLPGVSIDGVIQTAGTSGAGGGGYSTGALGNTTGGNGGNGGFPGGGGGGGGGGLSGVADSGAGGDGADGYVIVIEKLADCGGTNSTLTGNYTQTPISYQVLVTDSIVGVTNTAAPRTITMPLSGMREGQLWTIKDESGGSAANNITVSGNGINIDGSATFTINTNYGSVDIYYSGSVYFVK